MAAVTAETARVNPKHRHAEEREGKRLRNAEVHVRPRRLVVASPVPGPFAGPGKGAAPDDEGSFPVKYLEEGLVCSVENLVAEEIMEVVFEVAAVMRRVGTNGMDCQIAMKVVYDIRRPIHVPNPGGGRGSVV